MKECLLCARPLTRLRRRVATVETVKGVVTVQQVTCGRTGGRPGWAPAVHVSVDAGPEEDVTSCPWIQGWKVGPQGALQACSCTRGGGRRQDLLLLGSQVSQEWPPPFTAPLLPEHSVTCIGTLRLIHMALVPHLLNVILNIGKGYHRILFSISYSRSQGAKVQPEGGRFETRRGAEGERPLP